jgi:hypothetical protein
LSGSELVGEDCFAPDGNFPGRGGTGASSSFNQSSSSLVVFENPGAKNVCSQWGHFTRFPAAWSATETAPLQRGH